MRSTIRFFGNITPAQFNELRDLLYKTGVSNTWKKKMLGIELALEKSASLNTIAISLASNETFDIEEYEAVELWCRSNRIGYVRETPASIDEVDGELDGERGLYDPFDNPNVHHNVPIDQDGDAVVKARWVSGILSQGNNVSTDTLNNMLQRMMRTHLDKALEVVPVR